MDALASLLRVLEREDVSEIVLQTDRPVSAARHAGQSSALTRTPLTTAQIAQIVNGTDIAPHIGTAGPNARVHPVTLFEQPYDVSVQVLGKDLQLRMRRRKAVTVAVAQQTVERGTKSVASVLQAQVLTPTSVPDAKAETPRVSSRANTAAPPLDAGVAAQFLDILTQARKNNASDVHISANQRARVRYAGDLIEEGPELAGPHVEAWLHSFLSGPLAEQLEKAGYADLACEVAGAGRCRINIGRHAGGLKGCFRLVANQPPTLLSLGLPPDLENICKHHQGLVIISGPNGHGKTSTMAALVNLINSERPHHIITIEDPVEVIHPPQRAVITQRELGSHTRSFARALKAALREDPDVIVIGELRDRETVEIALSAAETGHLVIASMNTRSGAKTIDRLIELFAPDEQSQVRATLAGALKIVLSQRLVPLAEGRGLVAAIELLTGSVPLWNLIRDNKLMQLSTLQQRGRSLGMVRLDTSLQELVLAKKITLEAAKQFAESPAELERSLTQAAVRSPTSPPPVTPSTPQARAASAISGRFSRKDT